MDRPQMDQLASLELLREPVASTAGRNFTSGGESGEEWITCPEAESVKWVKSQ